MSIFTPNLSYETIYDIDMFRLKQKGIKCIALDIDNTLEPYHQAKPSLKLNNWIYGLISSNFTVVIVSNANKERITTFTEGFTEDVRSKLQIEPNAAKPLPKSYSHISKTLGIKKNEIAMVGDQIFTDILGGNLSKCLSIMVRPIDLSIEPGFVHFKRKIERIVYNEFGKQTEKN